MSRTMEDGDVILISSETKNQDGTQTFFLLDPCSEECADESPEIELIDLTTAEVKNTGAIAVLSTNINTGALELTLTKQADTIIKEEKMDCPVKNNSGQMNDDTSTEMKTPVDEIITDDDLALCPIKDEDEEVDVEEVSFHDIHVESDAGEQKSEAESLILEVSEENQQCTNDQDDDIDEGILYIDDAKYSEIQEELVNENEDVQKIEFVELQEVSDSSSNLESSLKDCNVKLQPNKAELETYNSENMENSSMNYLKKRDSGVVIDAVHPEIKEVEEQIKNQEGTSDVQEALIHGLLIKVPSEKQCLVDKDSDNEYVDSTNTALTLLELAGSPYRKTSEIESMKSDLIPQPTEFVSPHEAQDVSEPPTLTTLQPVPIETPVISEFTTQELVTSAEQESSKHQENTIDVSMKSDTPSSTTPRSAKSHTDLVQRLIHGDTPMLGLKGKGRIVTQAEITKEIYERSIEKCPYTEPSGGDFIFAMKLAHRLATKIIPSEKSATQIDSGNLLTDKPKDIPLHTKSQNSPVKQQEVVSKKHNDSITTKESTKNDAISDKIELLKILEDDPDEPDNPDHNHHHILLDIRPKQFKKSKARAPPLIKLNPELEKELALKQLEDFKNSRRKKSDFLPEALKNCKQGKDILIKHNENNNNLKIQNNGNQRNSIKRKVNKFSVISSKRLKKENMDGGATVDPSHITETLTVEGQSLVGENTKDGKSLKQYSNKRLSRNSETPPRQLPMEILLNGVENEDEFQDGKGLSKNKIFKATNPRKRQEELKKKRQKHFANMLQRTKPHKKRGRPPKKKPVGPTDDMLNIEFLRNMNNKPKQNKLKTEVNENILKGDSGSSTKDEKPTKNKKLNEIERLLGDEGAINMLYSIEQKRTIGSEPKRGMLPSYRRKKKDLILKTKLVKSAVLRLTTCPPQATGIALRGQPSKEDKNEENDDKVLRKMSVDSHDSFHSLSSPPPEVFPFPAKIVPAEASRIIRRHSSSSNYSSRSNSPRRLSVDSEKISVLSPEAKQTEIGQGDVSTVVSKPIKQSKLHHKKRVIEETVIRKLPNNTNTFLQGKCSSTSKRENSPQPNPSGDIKQTVNSLPSKTNAVKKRPGRPKKTILTEEERKITTKLNSSLAAAVEDFTAENENIDKNIPKTAVHKLTSPTLSNTRLNSKTSTPRLAVYRNTSAVTAVAETPPRKKTVKGPIIYNELTLKRHKQLVEICITPVSTKLKNAININVLKELISVFNGLSTDENCRVVLITSTGSVFCQGIDFFALIQPVADKRMASALEMAVGIKDFIKALAMFSKPVVAGVQGPAVGLGVTMLPLFDLVLACEPATFHTPYAKLGQVPEGAATLTLPSLLGPVLTSELLFACRKLTVDEAVKFGLVTRLLSTDGFYNELLQICGSMALQSSQAMNATKALLRHNLLTGIETTLVSETHLLIQHWTSSECQENYSRYFEQGDLSFPLTLRTSEGPEEVKCIEHTK